MITIAYAKIANLYKVQDILMFKEVYALEKIHGSSSHIRFKRITLNEDLLESGIEPEYKYEINFFSGGSNHDNFIGIFDEVALLNKFKEFDRNSLIIYGEAYGGKVQKMRHTYGDDLKFIAFEVKIGESWLDVPNAENVANNFGLEYVWYKKIKADINILNELRDQPSVQSKRNGIKEDQKAEGIVIRPPKELYDFQGGRVRAKHKREDFRETKTPRDIDPNKLKILSEAKAISEEWCTEMRLIHILDKLKANDNIFKEEMENVHTIILAMQKDIKIEAEGEIVYNSEVAKVIGRETVKLFKNKLKDKI